MNHKKIFLAFAFFSVIMIMAGNEAKAQTSDISQATEIALGGQEVCQMIGNGEDKEEYYWYQITIPENIGNQYFFFSILNTSSDGVEMELLTSGLESVKSIQAGAGDAKTIRIKTKGSVSSDAAVFIAPGETYYIKIEKAYLWDTCIGDVMVSVTVQPDDNWGSITQAEILTPGNHVSRSLEYEEDVDCFKLAIPNDGQKYCLTISGGQGSYTFSNGTNNQYGYLYTDDAIDIMGDGKEYYLTIHDGSEYGEVLYTIQLTAMQEPVSSGTDAPDNTGTKTGTNESSTSTAAFVTRNGVVYRISGSTAVVTKVSKELKKAGIAGTVQIGGKKYKVTKIAKNAFKGCKKLKTVTVKSKYLKSIAGSFQSCKKLKTVKVPKSCLKKYKKLFRKAGLNKKAKVK